MRRTTQIGSILSYIIVGSVLAVVLLGGLLTVRYIVTRPHHSTSEPSKTANAPVNSKAPVKPAAPAPTTSSPQAAEQAGQSNAANLPETGASGNILSLLGSGLLTWALLIYVRSRQSRVRSF